MPIHDHGYRRYAGVRVALGRGWWVIVRTGIRERIRESVSPRQSPSSLIRPSIRRDGDSRLGDASFLLFFILDVPF